MLKTLRRRAAPQGFTLLELIVVTLIILLMIGVAAPMFSKLVKTSRVQQTVNTVLTSLWHARSEAMRYRSNVAVLYGPDRLKCNPAPIDTPTRRLPAKGKIEIWTVKAGDSDSLGAGWGCYSPGFAPTPDWYPFSFPERDLTPQDFTYPDGVRIVCGRLGTGMIGTDDGTDFNNYEFQKSAIGQWKRYTSVFSRTGSHVTYALSNAYAYVLVFDEASGDYMFVKVGEWKSSTRPRILSNVELKKVCSKTLASYKDIPGAIDAWAGDR